MNTKATEITQTHPAYIIVIAVNRSNAPESERIWGQIRLIPSQPVGFYSKRKIS